MRSAMAIAAISVLVLADIAHARPQYQTDAPISYLVDTSSGTILFEKNSLRKIPPASMAKMMTTYIVFDMLAHNHLRLEQKFTVTPDIWQKWNNTGSSMFLKSGESVSVANLLHGTVTLSGNDSAITLATNIAGSEAAFVGRMNRMAKTLGMKNSHFGTANGWPDEGKTLTTAQDLALLAARTINDYPLLYHKFYGQQEFRWNGVTQADRNPITGNIKGADGLKTGHTDEAGYCFTGSAEQNGRRLIMVVAGLGSFNDRITESRRFMKWGFDAWTSKPLFKEGAIVASAPVQLGTQSRLSLIAPRNIAVTLPKGENISYKLFVRYNGPIKAPLNKDDPVANLVIKLSDGSQQIMPLIAADAIERAGFFGRAWNGFKSIFGA